MQCLLMREDINRKNELVSCDSFKNMIDNMTNHFDKSEDCSKK